MAVYVYVATSLDGYIAGPDGDIGWLMDIPNPENSDYGYKEFIAGIDALVMGRNTFEKVLGFGDWPYDKPVFVLSNTLSEVPDILAGKVELVTGPPASVVAQLATKGYLNLYVDGAQVVQGFLGEDLVDEMIITRVPILLGAGISLFGALGQKMRFAHRHTEKVSEALSQDHYVRLRK